MKKDFWKENGILVSLYGVVGVLVVTAGILTVNTLMPQEPDVVLEENVEVQASLVESYQDQIKQIREEDNNKEIERLKENLKENTEEKPIDESNLEEEPINEEPEEGEIELSNVQEEDLEEETTDENKTSSIYEEKDIETSEANVTEHELEKINKDTDKSNSEEIKRSNKTQEVEDLETSKLTWPLEGSIVMDFNDEVLVYDETLNLYRTNDSISIMASKGDEIVASANGRIIELGTNITDKGYIIVDHGNGYTTKYSQLLDTFVVNKGDEVRRGQIIGHVGEPSNMSTKQGTHLQYSLAKNDMNINPLQYLE